MLNIASCPCESFYTLVIELVLIMCVLVIQLWVMFACDCESSWVRASLCYCVWVVHSYSSRPGCKLLEKNAGIFICDPCPLSLCKQPSIYGGIGWVLLFVCLLRIFMYPIFEHFRHSHSYSTCTCTRMHTPHMHTHMHTHTHTHTQSQYPIWIAMCLWELWRERARW